MVARVFSVIYAGHPVVTKQKGRLAGHITEVKLKGQLSSQGRSNLERARKRRFGTLRSQSKE
jgi:hypothetical protein